jgi:hypothetical protein
LFQEFSLFCDQFIKKNFPRLVDLDDDFEAWLSGTSYSAADKEKLRAAQDKHADAWMKLTKTACKSFVKDEFYEELKPARSINARHDVWKGLFGPLIKRVEEEVFKHPSFVKKIPVVDRPRYILQVMESALPVIVEGDDGLMRTLMSDYSAFESLFDRTLIKTCELAVFRHMLGGSAFGREFVRVLENVCYRTNSCCYGNGVKVTVQCKRMSGEMFTSLGNSVTNLMVLAFLFEKFMSKDVQITEEIFGRLGLRAKVQHCRDPAEASFCGMVFDPQDCQMIRDPRPVLVKLGWCAERFVDAGDRVRFTLLHLKALSLSCEMGSCPILGVLARRLVALTQGKAKPSVFWSKYLTPWEKEKLSVNLSSLNQFTAPGDGTRALFERRYGISVSDQLRIEGIVSEMELGPLCGEVVELLGLPDRWADYWDEYVVPEKLPLDVFSKMKQPIWGIHA